jgi:NADPH2:quinone reductase
MLQGMTARYLLKGCHDVQPGSIILVHAASGGVGSILCQWARHLGAVVIGTVGSLEKAELAMANGCSHTILYREEDFEEETRKITRGAGVDVVYDSVGRDTFMKSLNCIRPMGTMVSFGQSSGPVEPFELGILAARGSLFLTRPSLMNYTAERRDLLVHAQDLFEVIIEGAVTTNIKQEYRLQDVAQAHEDLEARRTTGSSILVP